jgi:hypothetical protein
MTPETYIQGGKRQVKDLTLRELDMVYSLSRTGWSSPEIGRRYGISDADVGSAVDDYVDLRRLCQERPTVERPHPDQEPELDTNKARKRRSDAVYATAKERQAAYRARLQENHCGSLEQPSPSNETDSPRPHGQEPSVTVCKALVTEVGPEEAETQRSACYSSSVEGHDISESTPLPVTPEACSESEELRVIEE